MRMLFKGVQVNRLRSVYNTVKDFGRWWCNSDEAQLFSPGGRANCGRL